MVVVVFSVMEDHRKSVLTTMHIQYAFIQRKHSSKLRTFSFKNYLILCISPRTHGVASHEENLD